MTRRDGWYGVLLGLAIVAISGYAAINKQSYIRTRLYDDPSGGVGGWVGVALGTLLILVSIWRATRD